MKKLIILIFLLHSIYLFAKDSTRVESSKSGLDLFHSAGTVTMLPGSNQLIDLFTLEIYYDYRLLLDF